MEPYNVQYFAFGFYGFSILQHRHAGSSFPLLSSILRCGYTTLSFIPEDQHYIASMFFLYWILTLWRFAHKSLCGCIFSFLLGRHQGMELLGLKASLWLTVKETAKLFKFVTLFYISTRKLCGIFTYPHQHWALLVFWNYCSNHCSGCKVIACCGFNFNDIEYLLMWIWSIHVFLFVYVYVYSNIWFIFKRVVFHLIIEF